MTQTFKERIWRPGTITYIAARITLSDPSTKRDSNYTTNPGASPVLYLADRGQSEETLTTTPRGRGVLYNVEGDTQHYQPLILDWSVQHQEIGEDGAIALASGLLVLANKRVPWQQKRAGATAESSQIFVKLSQLRSDYLWDGAAIEMLLVTEQFDYSPVASVGVGFHYHKATTIFSGIIKRVRNNKRQMVCELGEDPSWNLVVPDSEVPAGGGGPSIITKKDYANAPPEAIGSCIPMVFGSEFMASDTNHVGINSTLLDCLSPCVVTEVGGSTSRYIRVFQNKWSSHGAAATQLTNTLFIHYPDTNLLGIMDYTDSITSTTEAYYDVTPTSTARLYINANRYISDTTVTDPQKAADGIPSTYAVVENNDILHLRVPFVGPYGQLTQMQSYIIVAAGSTGAGATDGTNCVEFGLWNASTGAWHLPTNNTGGKNPGYLTKAQVNAGGTFVSSAWASGAGTSEWDDPSKPFSAWRWDWVSATFVREDVYFRVKGIVAGVSCRVVAGGIAPLYLPAVKAVSKFQGYGGVPGGNGGLPNGGLGGRGRSGK